jgi:hypothetical protein
MGGTRRHDIPSILVVDDQFRLYAQRPLRGMDWPDCNPQKHQSETAEEGTGRHNQQIANHRASIVPFFPFLQEDCGTLCNRGVFLKAARKLLFHQVARRLDMIATPLEFMWQQKKWDDPGNRQPL